MQFVSFEQFLSMPKFGYIFFFSMDGYCGLCRQYEIEISKYDIQKLIKVNTEREENLMNIGIAALPCTRIYDSEEKICYEKYGVLYEKQIQDLLKYFSEM